MEQTECENSVYYNFLQNEINKQSKLIMLIPMLNGYFVHSVMSQFLLSTYTNILQSIALRL